MEFKAREVLNTVRCFVCEEYSGWIRLSVFSSATGVSGGGWHLSTFRWVGWLHKNKMELGKTPTELTDANRPD